MTTPQQMRDSNLLYLKKHGFQPADWMPLPSAVGEASNESGFSGGTLRPLLEVANRMLCHFAVFAWGSAPTPFEERIARFITANDLRASMTEEELAILNKPKEEASAEYAHIVGWRLENMWSLAWVLGVAGAPSATEGQMAQETGDALLSLFMPNLEISAIDLVADRERPSVEAIVQREDLFYLAHNAVRGAQSGQKEQVPADFDPIADGGAIHERRHSLTWCLAPGASWDETDLST